MKTKSDPRHLARIKTTQQLFATTFHKSNLNSNNNTQKILEHQEKIDKIIEKHAPAWPINQISSIDLAILRLAIWELLYDRKNPVKVVIDEAIEIAKSFGNETSSSFINGVLGSVLKEKKLK